MFVVGSLAVTLMSSAPVSNIKVPASYVGKSVINNPPVRKKVVALTFDDGPSPYTTPRVLAALKKYKARSTFFVVGQMASHKDAMLRQMIKEGHVIGNHSFSHPYHPDKNKAAYELKLTNEIIKKATGKNPIIFRPPGGVIDSWTARLAKAQGMASIIWTGSSADTATKSPQVVYDNVIAAAHPGAIILMHDVKEHTAQAVPRILATLVKKGYKFVTVPEMLHIWDEARKEVSQKDLAKKTGGAKPISF